MRKTLTDLGLPALIILLTGLWAMLFMPVMPIDETRYTSVAWEMLRSHSFTVPLLNGIPYSHKPPLLFWLIQAVWELFGISDETPRIISILSSLACIFLIYRISLRLWPEDRKTASCSALLLSSTIFWTLWSCAIMFDILLTAWILLTILGTLQLAQTSNKGMSLIIIGTAGGLLTKGPILMVYTLPLIVLSRLWLPKPPPFWRLKTTAAILAGFGLALLWAIPAGILGGEEYRQAIFWGQTAGRIHSSFAHQRPFGWYLPLLPAVFFPWIFFRPAFSKIHLKKSGSSLRVLLIWLCVPILILSCISGKQIHYLIPILPAGVLWMGQNITRFEKSSRRTSMKLIGSLYILTGTAALALPLIRMGADLGQLNHGATRFAAAGFIIAGGILLILRPRSAVAEIKAVSLCTLLVLLTALTNAKTSFLSGYNIKNISVLIQQKQNQGHPVVHVGKYHGQYQFLGRLTQSLPQINKNEDSIHKFIIEHPDGFLISYSPSGEPPIPGAEVLYTQRYRGESVILWHPGQLLGKNAL